jgi:hypothetical protein
MLNKNSITGQAGQEKEKVERKKETFFLKKPLCSAELTISPCKWEQNF